MRVCVIGAGVVGCATAFQLSEAGYDVILVDAADGPGKETSLANGGQLSYSYVEPLANPATLRGLPKMLLDKASPLRFELKPDWRQWLWGLQFLAACSSRQAAKGTRRLLEIAELSRQTMEDWTNRTREGFYFKRNGKLVLCPDDASLSRQAHQVSLQAYAGVPQEVLNRDECLHFEPALANYSGFVGGIWTETECAGDSYLFCRSLVEAAQENGMRCVFNSQVTGFAISNGAAHSVKTMDRQIEADAFVLATGARAPLLGRQLGESLPIYPIKGYSVTLQMKSSRDAPHRNVTDLSKKMVLAPLDGKLRVAAMAEVVGHDLRIPAERIEQISQAVEAIYPGLCKVDNVQPWAGLRPATPTSVPIVRRSRIRNVILNVGHGALGFTLAAGTAHLTKQLLQGH